MGGVPVAVLFCACRVYNVRRNHDGTQNAHSVPAEATKTIHEFFMVRGPSDWTRLGADVII